ncbi:MAG: DUF983 domain-containing protein [Chitinophagaceae bacterium]
MATTEKNPGYLLSVLTSKCPRCRQGNIYVEKNPYKFNSIVKMHDRCPVCGQPTEIEVGFYYGTSYVSYALAIALCVASFIAWWLIIGFSLKDSRFFWWLGFNAVLLLALQPVLMRMSRTLWLSWFVKYDHYWKERDISKEFLERIVPEQMGNW